MTKGPPVERAPFGALLAWAAIWMAALYIVTLGGGWPGIYATGLRSMSLVIVAAGLLVWAIVAWRRPTLRPRSAIWPALVLPLLALAIATVLSPSPRLGLEYVAWSVLLVALYLLLVRVMAQPFARERAGWLAAALGLFLGAWYAWQVATGWLEFWSLVGRLTPPPLRPGFVALLLGNPAAVLTLVTLLWLAAAGGLGFGTTARRTALAVQGALALFAIVLSGSRAGWLAVTATAILVGALWLLSPGHRGRLAVIGVDRRARAGLATALVALVVVGVVLLPGVVFRAGTGGEALRGQYLLIAGREFAAAPATGVGPGGWVGGRIIQTRADETDYYIPHAHDIYAQAAAETGVVGLGAGVVAMGCLAWLLLGGLRDPDPDRRRWAWAALAATVYFGLHQILDFYPNMPAVLFAWAIPVAVLDATSRRTVPLPGGIVPPATLRRAAVPTLAVACVLSIVLLARAEQIATVAQAAVTAMSAGDLTGARTPAANTAADDPDLPPYLVVHALAEAAAGNQELAAEAFRQAAEMDDLPQSWLGLAAAQVAAGRSGDARESLDRALRLGRQQGAVDYAAANLLDRIRDEERADDAYVEALTRLPSLAGDPTWASISGGADRFARLLDRAIEAAPAAGWELALMAGDPERANRIVGDSGDPELATLVIAAWGGDEAAIEAIQARAEASPLDLSNLGWAARVSAKAGDGANADRYRRWADLVNGTAGAAGYEVRVTSDPSTRTPAGVAAQFYGHYTYRRPTPPDLIAPGLPRLELVDLAAE